MINAVFAAVNFFASSFFEDDAIAAYKESLSYLHGTLLFIINSENQSGIKFTALTFLGNKGEIFHNIV